tara:strand:+ start:624 stop:935 length:312 start_codon:yes stop_codon:yes gene_type:complete
MARFLKSRPRGFRDRDVDYYDHYVTKEDYNASPLSKIGKNVCDDCKDEIALTDVEGHYDGRCRHCRSKDEPIDPQTGLRGAESEHAKLIAASKDKTWRGLPDP